MLFADFVKCYSSRPLLAWSVWWALSTCGYFQIVNYIQALWEDIHPSGRLMIYNGYVETLATLLGENCPCVLRQTANRRANLLWARRGAGGAAGGLPPRLLVHVGRAGAGGAVLSHGGVRVPDGQAGEHLGVLRRLRSLQGRLHAAHHHGNVSVLGLLPASLARQAFSVWTLRVEMFPFSFQIAANLSVQRYALVFGVNTFGALLLQTLLTLVVVDSAGLGLDINTQVRRCRPGEVQVSFVTHVCRFPLQFLIYAAYFTAIAVVFLVAGLCGLLCKRISKAEEPTLEVQELSSSPDGTPCM